MKNKNLKIVIYPMTGKQGPFFISKEWCRECDLLISLVRDSIRETRVEDRAEIKIRPWFLWAWLPLFRYFAWHPPILAINGKLISQGVVPQKRKITEALR